MLGYKLIDPTLFSETLTEDCTYHIYDWSADIDYLEQPSLVQG